MEVRCNGLLMDSFSSDGRASTSLTNGSDQHWHETVDEEDTVSAKGDVAPSPKLLILQHARLCLVKLVRTPFPEDGTDVVHETLCVEFVAPQVVREILSQKTPHYHREDWQEVRILNSIAPGFARASSHRAFHAPFQAPSKLSATGPPALLDAQTLSSSSFFSACCSCDSKFARTSKTIL